MARGYSNTLAPFQAHGYRQAVDYIEGRLSSDEALYHAQTRTRQYAKRQMTWFRHQMAPDVVVDPTSDLGLEQTEKLLTKTEA